MIFDLHALAEMGRDAGAIVVVDNTFATAVLQRPLALGATVVVHSTTKYMNGHSDVVGGAIVTSDAALAERLRFLQNAIGAVPSPFDCYLVLRGLKTLPLRMRRHVATAGVLAERMARHPAVRRVHYPGLPSDPGYALAKKQMAGPGGMISFEIDGSFEQADAFLRKLSVFACAESLGGVESLAEHPASMTHASIPRELRQAVGISDGLLRLSVGLEDEQDLWADLEAALEAATSV
jgi:cystathionine gamma-synthase/cystathionine gamma-lyase